MASPRNAEYQAYDETTQVGTLSRSTWLAQAAQLPKEKELHTPPSPFNIALAIFSCLVCPFLGWLSIIFAVQAQIEFKHKHYNESAALCTRSRGTSLYTIAIGISLALAYGILVGGGITQEWYN